MSFRLSPVARASTLVAGAALFGAVALGPTSASAGDDGQAPIWVGVASIFGWDLSSKKNDEPIDYRERGKIVLPAKMDLPPPGSPAANSAAAWPVDPDVETRKREIEKEKARPDVNSNGYVTPKQKFSQPFDQNAVVTVRATAGQGPGNSCPQGRCDQSVLSDVNPLGWFGDKKTLGPEPPRSWLTDPPKGYRAPYAPNATAQAEPQGKKPLDPHITPPAFAPDNSN